MLLELGDDFTAEQLQVQGTLFVNSAISTIVRTNETYTGITHVLLLEGNVNDYRCLITVTVHFS
jgi:hypothetical protein